MQQQNDALADPAAREAFYRTRGLWTDEALGYLAGTAAARWPAREFICLDDIRYTYADFWRWTVAVAHDLLARGLRPGDKILLQVANGMEVLVLQFAAWRIGVVCVPVVPLYRSHELIAIVRELQPRVIAVSQHVGSRNLADEFERFVIGADFSPIARYLIGGDDRSGWSRVLDYASAGRLDESGLPEPTPAGECCLVLYTSGTTAAPKGAMLTSRSLLSHAASFRLKQGLSEEMVTLAASPLSHIAALATSVINPMTVGGRTVIMRSWQPDLAAEMIERERITHLASVVTYLQDLLEQYANGKGSTHRLKVVAIGGAPVPPSIIVRADALGIKAFAQFGMTEIAANATLGSPGDPLERRSNYCGKVMFGTQMQAVDQHRHLLPPGESGELRVRSPQMMLGYINQAETARQVDEAGWFYTGDVGSVDAQGWVRINGRIKDIINRGGEKFSAQDIEHALLDAPGIVMAAVVGAPHPRFGEVVAAFLKLRAGVRWDGPEAILAHLENIRLARSKFPVIWHIVDDLPRTASGKVQKQALLALLKAEHSP